MARSAVGLVLALVAAVAINWSYSWQHDVVVVLPDLSFRRPLRFLSAIFGSRVWLVSFALQGFGWVCYLAALRLSPLSLVQGVGASGIAVLAFASARGRLALLERRERAAVAAGFAGLVLLSLSVIGTTQRDRPPSPVNLAFWLGCVSALAALLASMTRRLGRAPALGLAAGFLFAAGDICSKLVVLGHAWLAAAVPLLATYGLGTSVLQFAFQHGNALTGAGLATLATNAVPIIAGFVLFDERLPGRADTGIQFLAFALLVGGAVLLARTPSPRTAAP